LNWQERITIDPWALVGKPIIRGTRIAVEFVVELLAKSWTFDRIFKEYDHLSREDIPACLAYASGMMKSERIYPMTG
jgi:uncharacterized protein (DUF433 family)